MFIRFWFRCSKNSLGLADFVNWIILWQISHARRCLLVRGSIVVSRTTPSATVTVAGWGEAQPLSLGVEKWMILFNNLTWSSITTSIQVTSIRCIARHVYQVVVFFDYHLRQILTTTWVGWISQIAPTVAPWSWCLTFLPSGWPPIQHKTWITWVIGLWKHAQHAARKSALNPLSLAKQVVFIVQTNKKHNKHLSVTMHTFEISPQTLIPKREAALFLESGKTK